MAKNKWVTGVKTPRIGVITLFRTGRGPPCNFDTRTGERSHLPPCANRKSSTQFGAFPIRNVGQFLAWRIIPIGKWLVTSIYLPFKPFGRVTTLFRGLTDHACQLRPLFSPCPAQPSEAYTPPDWPRAVRCHIVAPSHGLD